MKKTILILSGLVFLLFSCNNAEIEQLKNENETLRKTVEERDQDINSFMQVFNEIEENLAEVRTKEKLIVNRASSFETGVDRVEAVKNDIRSIDELMSQNRENLKNLSNKLKSSKGENKELGRMLANLEKIIGRKDAEIVSLVSELEDLNFEVEDLYTSVSKLTHENLEQGRIIDTQKTELNTAYYITGSKKDLKEKEIITKKGGFIGIRSVDKLRQDFEKDLFTKIDIRETTVFPIDAKKVNLVTTHPSDSYIIRKNDEKRYFSFEITKPEDFWRSSKYLVLVLD